MTGEGQYREQAKKQWEKLDAEGRKIINDLIVVDKDRTIWPENTEPKFTGKKGTKLIKVAFDTKSKKYTHAYEEKEEVPVNEVIRLDDPDAHIYFCFHPTKTKYVVIDTQQAGARCQICHNSTPLPLDSRKKHYSKCATLICHQNYTFSQKQLTKSN